MQAGSAVAVNKTLGSFDRFMANSELNQKFE